MAAVVSTYGVTYIESIPPVSPTKIYQPIKLRYIEKRSPLKPFVILLLISMASLPLRRGLSWITYFACE